MRRYRDDRTSRQLSRQRGSPCSTAANQASRFYLTQQNPLQGNSYQGGGPGSVLVGYGAMANYNGLITTVQHRLSSTFSLLANYTWSKCLNIYDAQGDYAGTGNENPAQPDWITARAALITGTWKMSFLS